MAIISCQKELKLERESFNLKQNYTMLSAKMTMKDTIGVFVSLSLYYHDFRSDYLNLTKSNDSLKIFISRQIGLEIRDGNGNRIESEYEEVKRLDGEIPDELIVLRESELLLRFDKLIQENKNLLEKTSSYELPQLIFQNQSDTLLFNFSSKKDWKKFKYDYCQLMYNFSSYKEHYKEWANTYFKDSIR